MDMKEEKVSAELLKKIRKEEKRVEWGKRKEERDEANFWGQSTLQDSYLRIAGHLLGIVLFLYFVTIFSMPILFLTNKIHPPFANSYVVVVTVICSVGYGLWRFLKWAD